MLKIAILDDENTALMVSKGVIDSFLASKNIPFSIDSFDKSDIFLANFQEEKYQLVFLDIDMPEKSGIEVGKEIKKMNPSVDIIYISQREDLVFDTLALLPFGFVRKAKILEDFPKVLELYINTYLEKNDDSDKLSFSSKNGINVFNINDILYIEGNKNYQTLYLKDNTTYNARSSMQELEKQLSTHGFIRIHKGYLVNYLYIRRIESTLVSLTNGARLPLATQRKEEILEEYLMLSRQNNFIYF